MARLPHDPYAPPSTSQRLAIHCRAQEASVAAGIIPLHSPREQESLNLIPVSISYQGVSEQVEGTVELAIFTKGNPVPFRNCTRYHLPLCGAAAQDRGDLFTDSKSIFKFGDAYH